MQALKMQQQQQQHQQPPPSQPQPQPQPQPHTLNSGSSFPPNSITTEQIQKCLDDNKNLIMAILENQNLGKFQECAQYQAVLQKNLMYLAAIADAQPPAPTPTPTPTPAPPPQTLNPSQMPPNSIPQQANSYMQQHQVPAASQQAQQAGVPKLPFQLNALRTQQLLQFQQQQEQQLQAQMGMRAGGAQNGMLGMHQAMQSALGGMKQDASDAASGGDGQGKPRS